MSSQAQQQQQQQQQQHQPAPPFPPSHFTLQHILSFTPPQQQPGTSSHSPFYTLPHHPHFYPYPHTVTESDVSAAAARFHTTVTFPTSLTGQSGFSNPPSAFHQLQQPFLSSQQPGSQSAFIARTSLSPNPSLGLQHSPFALTPPPSYPPLPSPPPLPTSAAAPTNADAALFHAALAARLSADPAIQQPYPQHPTPFAPSPPYPVRSFPFPTPNQATATAPPQHARPAPFPVRSVRASVWHCPLGCGQSYKKSSGRSIRRHYVACFRQLNRPAAAALSDAQLSTLIAERQDTGQLQTGLRRWRMRSSRRRVDDLKDQERWECVWGCGKRYRSTSTRSIQRHLAECDSRPGGGGGSGRRQARRSTTRSSSERGRDEEDEEDEEEDDDGEEEEAEAEEEDRVQVPAAKYARASTDTAPPPFSFSAPTASPALPTAVSSSLSYAASIPSPALQSADPLSLQSLSSAASSLVQPTTATAPTPLAHPSQSITLPPSSISVAAAPLSNTATAEPDPRRIAASSSTSARNTPVG